MAFSSNCESRRSWNSSGALGSSGGRSSDGRHAKFDDIKPIANGKVWTGQQAAQMKLIDQVADFQAAVEDTAKSVGIRGEPVLVRPEKDKKTLADLLFGDLSEWLPSREKLMDQHVGFYYMWK